jgi:hypothetical protein
MIDVLSAAIVGLCRTVVSSGSCNPTVGHSLSFRVSCEQSAPLFASRVRKAHMLDAVVRYCCLKHRHSLLQSISSDRLDISGRCPVSERETQ